MPFVAAFVLGLAFTPVARWVGLRAGLVDRPESPLKIHVKPVPVLGGLAVVFSVLAGLAWAGRALPVMVTLGLVVTLMVGVADDARSLPVAIRVAAEVGAAALIVAGGVSIRVFGPLGGVAVVLLALACMNAVNLMDGQDGLVGGLGGLAAIALGGLGVLGADPSVSGLGLALAGSLVAFLVWNLPPARIFLGDGGAYAVGMVLALLAVGVVNSGGLRALLAAALCLGVFAFELIFTVVRRIWSKDPLVSGDRSHSYDLLARKVSRPRVNAIFWGLGLLAGGVGLAVASVPMAAAVAATAAVCTAAVVFGVRLWAQRVPEMEEAWPRT